MLAAYADDATLLAVVPSSGMISGSTDNHTLSFVRVHFHNP